LDTEAKYFFVIDDIINKKRLKEIPLINPERDFSLFFTPSFVFFHCNEQEPWMVLDNNLQETTHPFIDLLKKNEVTTHVPTITTG
jgi:hypothetical protein